MESLLKSNWPASVPRCTSTQTHPLASFPTSPQLQRHAFFSEDEALFVKFAFSRLLPTRQVDSRPWLSRAVEFVDERLRAGHGCVLQLAIDLGVGELRLTGPQVARTYRNGIAAVQRHCRLRYSAAFKDLPPPQQDIVLGLLERGARPAGLHDHTVLFPLLVQHAAEAYFDFANVGEKLTRCA